MADLRRLSPGDVLRLLNSTPVGEVLTERRLRRHRSRAGFRIGDAKHLDLFRYLAWLADRHHAPQEAPDAGRMHEAHKERERARAALASESGRDIGELPKVVDLARKAAAEQSFQKFCDAYFPEVFHLPWSDDHLKVIAKIEQAVLHGGLFAMAMPRGSGKALALDTPLPTPTGWTTMGEVQEGDVLFDDRGLQCHVIFATRIQYQRPCFRVDFDDDESIVCDADHLWTVHDRYDRRGTTTLTTESMSRRFRLPDTRGRNAHRYRIDVAKPLQIQPDRLPIHPYVLGAWLGDGTTANAGFTCHENETREFASQIAGAGEALRVYERQPHGLGRRCWIDAGPFQASPLNTRLRLLGVLGDKHIPIAYLRADVDSRRALLQGLMDTDGHIARDGACELTLKAGALADQTCELITSLGIKIHRSTRMVLLNGKECGPYLRISFHATRWDNVFRLTRKWRRLPDRVAITPMSESRRIVGIVPVPSVPVRCIQVDSPSRLYLAGRGMIPTHNTTIAECACLWAVLYGHRDFVCLIGSDEGHAADMLESLKTELEGNELLEGDFPEAVYPIARLEGIANRANGQLFQGERTHIGWTAREIVLPTIPGSKASGAIIKVAGITGRIRGMKFKRPDGRAARPSLVVLDDPQTDESARSPSQCQHREAILAGAVLGLAGPGKKISGIMPCTVIRPDDMADRILDRDLHPEWNGERTRMVYSFPSDTKLWEEYAKLRAEGLRAERGLADATAFYLAHREAMDAGSRIAWPARFNHDEASALQHAMNLKLQDERAFWAEYQNEPLPEIEAASDDLTAEQILAKLNGLERAVVPTEVAHLTAFVDVQQKALFWAVCGWADDFTGYVLDYGTWPDQRRAYFTLRDLRITLATATKGAGLEGQLYAGLEKLTGDLLARRFRRDDGAEMTIGRCLVDANWGQSTDVVYQFCRQSPHAAVLMPSHGRFVGASSIPFADYRRKRGDRLGLNWRIPAVVGRRTVRHVLYDTNFWKSFLMARLAVPMGDPGCLSLYGHDRERHRLLAEHLTAEYRVRTEGRGRVVDEWKLRPESFDNHWLDGLVGCAVGASMGGVGLACAGVPEKASPKAMIRLSDLRRQ